MRQADLFYKCPVSRGAFVQRTAPMEFQAGRLRTGNHGHTMDVEALK